MSNQMANTHIIVLAKTKTIRQHCQECLPSSSAIDSISANFTSHINCSFSTALKVIHSILLDEIFNALIVKGLCPCIIAEVGKTLVPYQADTDFFPRFF